MSHPQDPSPHVPEPTAPMYDQPPRAETPYQQGAYEQSPYQQGAYEQSPYQQAPYQETPYQQGAYEQSPYQAQYEQPQAQHPGWPAPAYDQPPIDSAAQHYGSPGQPSPERAAEERTWATISHVGSFLSAWLALGVICPIIVLLAKPDRPFVRHHAYESLNFQLNTLAWVAITTVVSVITLGLGTVLFVPLGLWYLVLVIVAGVRANAGDWYRYPFIVRLFNP